ncbi:MAG TPA: tRNA (adenosine(37)-N6)-threonylcarbamoyltransferase complex transferase subunit TsaD, partial [Candidatus Cloacimonetes bacterium]|nr:tRNA (adenosine(37)-N6)-threonylcarbamoyltransferase complex transferase subunit TsaD [Candidatus Cloacimonadota bacterium]
MKKPLILAIETSCDDTSAALVDGNCDVLSNVISSQEEVHLKYGGIVPELASREHIRTLIPIVEMALEKADVNIKDVKAVAVSANPGLIGSLLVGVSFAKGLAFSLKKPLIAVNHIFGHVFANFLEHKDIKFPFLSLIVSGGHTELVIFSSAIKYTILGKTVDDAAGEAFDKIGKLLGLPYPGGPH